MKNQPNEMVMLEWLLPLFDEKLSQIFECWQNSKDNFEDVAAYYHQLSKALLILGLPSLAENVAKLGLFAQNNRHAVNDQQQQKIKFIHQLLRYELTQYSYSGHYQDALTTSLIDDIAQTRAETALAVEDTAHTSEQSIPLATQKTHNNHILVADHKALAITSLSNRGITKTLQTHHYQQLLIVWRQQLHYLFADNTNQASALQSLEKVSHYLSQASVVNVEQALWYAVELWLHNLAYNIQPVPSHYASILIVLEQIIEIYSIQSESRISGNISDTSLHSDESAEHEVLATDNIQSLINDICTQLNALTDIDSLGLRLLDDSPDFSENKVKFLPYILMQIDGLASNLDKPHALMPKLQQISSHLSLRGWVSFEEKVNQILKIVSESIDFQSSQTQEKIKQLLGELHTQISDMDQAIRTKIGDATSFVSTANAVSEGKTKNIDDKLEESDTPYQLRLSLGKIKHRFNDYNQQHELQLLPSVDMFNEFGHILSNMGLVSIKQVVDKFADLVAELFALNAPTLSRSLIEELANGLSAIELLLDYLAQQVFDQPLLAQVDAHIDSATQMLDDLLIFIIDDDSSPAIVNSVIEKPYDPDVERYDDEGAISRVGEGLSDENDSAKIFESADGSHQQTNDFYDDEELRDIFIEEMQKIIPNLEQSIAAWQNNHQDLTPLLDLHRGYHNLKGSGSMVGAASISQIASIIENLLNHILDKSLAVTADVVRFIEQTNKYTAVLFIDFIAQRPASVNLALTTLQSENLLSGRSIDDGVSTLEESQAIEDKPDLDAEPNTKADGMQEPVKMQVQNLVLPAVLEPFIAPIEQLPADTTDADPDIKEIFLEEADEVLTEITPLFHKWQQNLENLTPLADIRRGFHTLKGSGRMVGAYYTAELAWAIEDMLNRLLDNSIAASMEIVELIGDVLLAYPSLMTVFSDIDTDADSIVTLNGDNNYPAIVPLWIICAQAYSKNLGNEFSYCALRSQWFELSCDEKIESSIDSHITDMLSISENTEKKIDENDDSESIESMLLTIRSINDRMTDATVIAPVHNKTEHEFFEIFNEEAQALLKEIASFIDDNEDQLKIEVSDEIVRAFHIMRAASGSTALVAISEVSDTIEQSLKQLQQQDIMMSAQHLQAIKQSAVLIESYLSSYHQSLKQGLDTDNNHESQRDLVSLKAMLNETDDNLLASDLLDVTQLLDIGIDALLDAEWQLRTTVDEANLEQVQLYVEEQREQIARLMQKTTESSKFSIILDALNDAYRYISEHPKRLYEKKVQDALIAGHSQVVGLFDALAASMSLKIDAEIIIALQGIMVESAAASTTETLITDGVEVLVESKQADNLQLESIKADIELLEIFLEEAQELDDAIAEIFGEWQNDIDNIATVKILQRHLHTIKGGARMADIRSIGDLTHQAESIYEAFVEERLKPTKHWLSIMQIVQDTLSLQIDHAINYQESFFAEELIAQLQEFEHAEILPSKVILLLPALQQNSDVVDLETEANSETVIVSEAELEPEPEPEPEELLGSMDSLVTQSWGSGLPHPDILEVFLEEADELIASSNKYLQLFLANKNDVIALQVLQRDLHNIKGGARMVAANGIADLAHQMEKTYEDLASRRRPANKMIVQLLISCHDWLSDAIYILTNQLNPPVPKLFIKALQRFNKSPDSLKTIPAESLQAQLHAILLAERKHVSVDKVDEISEMPSMVGSFVEQEQSSNEMIRISSNLIERMINLSGESAINRARIDMSVSSLANSIEDMGTTIQRLADQLRRMEAELEEQILSKIDDVELIANEDFDPLEMDQYSSLNQLSKSLTESASDLLDINNTLLEKTRDSENLLLQLSRTQTELQDGLTNSRMVPFSRLTPRLERIVRQTANELNKSVKLTILNADDEMDRTILERITAPLDHMLRNAVDHGIESPQSRINAGKDRSGHITLEVLREGSEIVIHLIDDGQGIDVNAVRKKAISQNLIDADDNSLSDLDVMQYIFNAGLTTTKKVTQISGRGVGMDVVISEIRQLGGVVSVNSESGKGSRFTIRVPLTVAVSDALIVRAADRYYAIPLVQIERVVRIDPEKLYNYYHSGPATMRIDKTDYRVRYLNEILTGNKLNELIVSTNISLPIIIVKNRIGQSLALQVDQIAGSRIEVVVKPLGRQLSHLEGISAATIMGDGSVMLILDLIALLRHVPTIKNLKSVKESNVVKLAKKPKVQPTVLVVDDSVTVRKVTSRFLERQGIIAIVAKDGIDAIEILQELTPDLILLDIEMPRMDGFEVAIQIRHNQRLQQIPIIMITSRTGEKHRERAFAIGVNDYMGKPFQEDDLLANIQKLLGSTISLTHEKI